jgi:ATP-dependent protease ClpP protease subunit
MQVCRRLCSRLQALCACLALAACQPPPPLAQTATAPEPSPVNGIGYIIFAAPINRGSSALLIKDMDRLQAQGAREIDLAMNSAGGEIIPAESIVTEMDRLHVQDGIIFNAYDLHFVASAAALVFLDAQGRYAVPHSGFLFHAPALMAAGVFSAEALRKGADQVDRDTQMFRDVLLARTHLTRQQIDVYVSRTVVLSTDDALHDGVIDAVKGLTVPKDTRAWVIKTKPKSPAHGQDILEHPAAQQPVQG